MHYKTGYSKRDLFILLKNTFYSDEIWCKNASSSDDLAIRAFKLCKEFHSRILSEMNENLNRRGTIYITDSPCPERPECRWQHYYSNFYGYFKVMELRED